METMKENYGGTNVGTGFTYTKFIALLFAGGAWPAFGVAPALVEGAAGSQEMAEINAAFNNLVGIVKKHGNNIPGAQIAAFNSQIVGLYTTTELIVGTKGGN
jgi:hypothetical protein